MEGWTPKSGSIRHGTKGGGIEGWGGGGRLETANGLSHPGEAGGSRRGRGVALAARLGLVGGSSPLSYCLRVGGNAASRLTLTITLGEEKAFGCNGYFVPGP